MELVDILPKEKWVELEKEINQRSGLNASVFNTDGVRITDYKKWANDLCPVIKANDKGQSFICAVAHMNLAAQAKNGKETVIEECDAGLVKLVTPIFVDDVFLGAVGGCGFVMDDSEADSFLINKITEIDTEEIESLAEDIPSISTEDLQNLGAFIEERLEGIVREYKNS